MIERDQMPLLLVAAYHAALPYDWSIVWWNFDPEDDEVFDFEFTTGGDKLVYYDVVNELKIAGFRGSVKDLYELEPSDLARLVRTSIDRWVAEIESATWPEEKRNAFRHRKWHSKADLRAIRGFLSFVAQAGGWVPPPPPDLLAPLKAIYAMCGRE